MIAIDTNLLVYAHRSALPEHRRARRAIERASAAPGGWGIPLPCVAEFWAVVTHPASAGRPSRPREARGFLAALARAGARTLLPTDDFAARLAQLAVNLGLGGSRIFDLQIALIALEASATEIWTHDRRFVTLPRLAVVDPL